MSDHSLLMIPGPIEFSDEVLQANAHPSMSHVGAPFINVFGESLELLRKVFVSEDAQPLVIAGSGTLGWDIVAANITERGDNVLVLHTGYFGDSFAECFETYGVTATQLKAAIGERPTSDQVEAALKERKYKLVSITHVDTSTGVLSDVKLISEVVRRVSPDTLIVVDGVCSVGGEELLFDEWGVDIAITASQKAIGVPPGLSISAFSKRAISTFNSRTTPPSSYFASLKKWLPIMQAYESRKPMYFATPPVQLIYALHASLKKITERPMSERFQLHKDASNKVKSAVRELGLKQVPTQDQFAANTMTAVYLPEGLTLPDVLPKLSQKGIIFAGGLHREIATKYFRIGHMGITATDSGRNDLDKAIQGLKEVLSEATQKH
ncbi:alanine-glyoxylate aminotransferase [Acrasis kona]|uniref:alanine--glyoxylate transaminase n=1 Tax=Acrasis kona TaxID=1008807 RepID=A0AAW2ZNQ1_9EUKA